MAVAAATATDHRVSVWDLRRPFLPWAVVNAHLDKVPDFSWKNDDEMLAASADGHLSALSFKTYFERH